MRERYERDIRVVLRRHAPEAIAEWVLHSARSTAPADGLLSEIIPHVLSSAQPVLDPAVYAALANALAEMEPAQSAMRTLTIRSSRDVRRARMLARTLGGELGLTRRTIIGLIDAVTEVGERTLQAGVTGTLRLEALVEPVPRVRVTSYMLARDSRQLLTEVTEHGAEGNGVWDALRQDAGLDVRIDGNRVKFVFELAD